MLKNLLLLLAALSAAAQDDPWSKVRELSNGAELRIYRTGVRQPVSARMNALSDDALIVMVKNGQLAIPKDEIRRVDARTTGGRTALEARRNVGTQEDARVGRTKDSLPPLSTSGGVRIRPKSGFETVYDAGGPTARPPAR